MKTLIILAIAQLLSIQLFSQLNTSNNFSTKGHLKDGVPEGKIRAIAEFEPMEGVLVAYTDGQFMVPMSLLKEIAESNTLYTVVSSSSEEDEVKAKLSDYHVNLDNCRFIHGYAPDEWIRDYGPIFISSNDSISIINRPPFNVSSLLDKIGQEFHYNIYDMDILLAGGNWMCDGMGIAASVQQPENLNLNYNAEQIDSIIKEFTNTSEYHWRPLDMNLLHIDMFAKFLDIDKILIMKVPEDEPNYELLEAEAEYWKMQISSYGTNYQVFRVYNPNFQPYINSLIFNEKVFVPLIRTEDTTWNVEALKSYQDAMPGYEIIGIEANHPTQAGITWFEGAALHCRTHEVPDPDMIYIEHNPFYYEYIEQFDFEFQANVTSYGGKEIASCNLYYSIDESEYVEREMTKNEGNLFMTEINVTDKKSGSINVKYYLVAEDETGKTAKHPFIGVDDPHEFYAISINIPENKQELFSFRAFPNPASEELFFSIQSNENQLLYYQIVDVNGKLIADHSMHIHSGNYIEKIDVSHFKSGIYLLKIFNKDGFAQSKRFLKH